MRITAEAGDAGNRGPSGTATRVIDYRHIQSAADEGPLFAIVLRYVADFYRDTMRGQVRGTDPGALLKWSRDWEYPWVIARAEISHGDRALDCGSGFSPVPFILAHLGATVDAIDRDARVSSRPGYALRCAAAWVRDAACLPVGALGAFRHRNSSRPEHSAVSPEQAPDDPRARTPRPRNDGWSARAGRFLAFRLWQRHRVAWGRIRRPDFWGPVSPSLLRRYGVRYRNADMTQLPFDAAEFDVVTCVSVLEHMPPEAQRQGVQEMSRVLKPGGRLLLTYDRHDCDLTDAIVTWSGLEPAELVCLDASHEDGRRMRPDVIGIRLDKPRASHSS